MPEQNISINLNAAVRRNVKSIWNLRCSISNLSS
jgi:hypothetical protein